MNALLFASFQCGNTFVLGRHYRVTLGASGRGMDGASIRTAEAADAWAASCTLGGMSMHVINDHD